MKTNAEMVDACKEKSDRLYKWQKKFIHHLGVIPGDELSKMQEDLLKEIYEKRCSVGVS